MMSTIKEEIIEAEDIQEEQDDDDDGYAHLTVKEVLQEFITGLPDDATWEDVKHRVDLFQSVHESDIQIANGEGIPYEEVKKRFSKWLE